MYKTACHAKLALMVVLMVKVGGTTMKERFLSDTDFVVLIPNEHWGYDLTSSKFKKKQMAICCLMCTQNELVALDLDQLRYIDFKKNYRSVEAVKTKIIKGKRSSRSKLEHVVCNLTKHCQDDNTKKWGALPHHMLMYFMAKLLWPSNHTDIVAYMGEPKKCIHFHIPPGTVKTEKLGKDVPPGFTTISVRRINNPKKLDCYYYTPEKHYRLHSRVELDLFNECLEGSNNNDTLAIQVFKAKKCDKNLKGGRCLEEQPSS